MKAKRIERDAKTDGIALVRVPVPDAGFRNLPAGSRWSRCSLPSTRSPPTVPAAQCGLGVLLGAQVFLGDARAHATWVGDAALHRPRRLPAA